MDCSLPGSSIHGIFQARVLEWGAIAFSEKNATEEFIYRAVMEKQTQRGKERVRCMERVTWNLTLPYVKEIANRNLLCGSGNSKRGSVST